MSNYTKTTDFAAKDSLTTGDAGKIIRGAEFGTEFDNIATAIATKADTAGPTLTGTTTFDTLSDGTIAVTAFVDEDDMSSDSATMLPTQQSVKAYVDSQATAQDLDFEADTGGPLSIDLDSETLTFTGGTGIDTSGVDNAVTFAIDNTVTTLTDTQTLTNKTLTSPTLTGTTLTGTTLLADLIVNNRQVATDDASGVNIDGNDVTVRGGASTGTGAGGSLIFQTTPADVAGNLVNTFSTVMTLDESGIDVAGEVEFDSLSGTGAVSVTDILDEDDMTSDSDTSLATQQSIKAYVDSQVAGADSLAEVLTNGNTTDGTDIAVGTGDDITFADSSKAIFGAGSDLQIYHSGSASHITDSGTGNLLIQGTDVRLQNAGATANYLKGTDGAEVSLFYAGGEKLATTSTGIDVTGVITTDGMTTSADINFGDNDKAIFGAGSDLQIYHDGTHSVIYDAGVGDLRINAVNLNLRSSASGENYLYATNNGAVQIYYDGAEKLTTTNTGIDVTGTVASDGLTVDGIAEISSTTPTLRFFETDQTDEGTLLRSAGDSFQIAKMLDTGAADGIRLAIDQSSGDISFYEDTGTTAKLQWSASNERLTIPTLTISDGSITTTAATGDHTVFNSTGADADFRVRTGANTHSLYVQGNTGNVGIGTDNPEELLHLSDTGGNAILRLTRDDTTVTSGNSVGSIQFAHKDADDAGVAAHILGRATNAFGKVALVFATGNPTTRTERMRLDAEGNLLVGTTDTNPTTGTSEGIVLGAGGIMLASNTSDAAIALNRTSTDGDIAIFKKNGTPVGSIGVTSASTDIYIGSGDCGVRFDNSNQAIKPWDTSTNAAETANPIDIGASGARFQDLYLSGGVYLGGTGSANKLDDYEEGTFTGAVSDASSGGNESSSVVNGTYVKVGAVVYVQFNVSNIDTTGMTAGNDVFITGLPFVTKSVSGTAKYTGTANLSVVTFEQTPFMQVNEGQAYVKILEVRSGAGNDAVVVSQLSSSASDIHGNLVYETA